MTINPKGARLLRGAWHLLLLLVAFSISPLHASVTPATCADDLEVKKQQALEDLRELEQAWNETHVHFIKYWETTYNPLWMAQLKREDKFSTALQADGEMLFDRYSHFAEEAKIQAQDEQEVVDQKLASFTGHIENLTNCCPVTDTKECLSFRRDEIKEELMDFTELIQKNAQDHRLLSGQIEQTLHENPSEHLPFGNRYAERFERWNVKVHPEFLMRQRMLREKLEVDWPAEKCCALCTADKLGISQDPVLNALKPDAQGSKGVSGQVVNQADVVKAFEEHDEEK